MTDTSGMFDIDIVSDPSASLFPDRPMWSVDMHALCEYDEHLVKPALLFADKVHLRSSREDMLSMVRSTAMRVNSMPVRTVTSFVGLSYRRDPQELDLLGIDPSDLAPVEECAPFLGEDIPDFAELMSAFAKKYSTQISEAQSAVLTMLKQRRDALVGSHLAKAADKGLITTSGWATTANDTWSLAWSSEDEFLDQAVDEIEAFLLDASGAVMLEPGSQWWVDQVFRLGATGAQGCSDQPNGMTPSFLAANFISRLPGLRDVGLDEVIDMREDLSDVLVPFRQAMTEMSSAIRESEHSSSRALQQEVDRRWHGEVLPAMHEIQHKTRSSGYPRQLLAAFSEDKGALAAAASSVALVAGSVVSGVALLAPAALVTGAVPFVKALNNRLHSKDELRLNRMYFLYELNRRVKKTL